MAFKNSQTIGGAYLSDDLMFINADNSLPKGYDTSTLPSNENKITASDAVSNAHFGRSVAVGNGRIVVGSGDYNNVGAAYIFDLDGTQIAKITASDAASNDNFGQDGNTVAVGSGRIVVGAPMNQDAGYASGSAYIFDLDGTQLAKITASDAAAGDNFGYSVAVGNGIIVVGAYGNDDAGSSSGSAYIFDLDGTQLAKITASDAAAGDTFGRSVAVGNGRIVVSAYSDNNRGSAYIFNLAGTQLAKITASDPAANDYFGQFGSSVAVGSDRIVVGAELSRGVKGSAYIFDLDGTQIAKIIPSADAVYGTTFGNSVAVGSGRIVVGAKGGGGSGFVYIFDLDGTQIAKITASNAAAYDYFGGSVAVGNDRIVVGADQNDAAGYNSGSAYIYNTPDIKHTLDILT